MREESEAENETKEYEISKDSQFHRGIFPLTLTLSLMERERCGLGYLLFKEGFPCFFEAFAHEIENCKDDNYNNSDSGREDEEGSISSEIEIL